METPFYIHDKGVYKYTLLHMQVLSRIFSGSKSIQKHTMKLFGGKRGTFYAFLYLKHETSITFKDYYEIIGVSLVLQYRYVNWIHLYLSNHSKIRILRKNVLWKRIRFWILNQFKANSNFNSEVYECYVRSVKYILNNTHMVLQSRASVANLEYATYRSNKKIVAFQVCEEYLCAK